MVGGAVGDALGYPVEFMSYRQIVAQYGPDGINRYELNANGVAEISDDTQMSLYTAGGILIDDIETAYLEWLRTQRLGKPLASDYKCRISRIPDLYSRRAPGTTCLSALTNIEAGKDVSNNSKGCGGIMRVAPIALWGASHAIDIKDSVNRAFDAARLTHKHILGWLPAGMLVFVIQRAIETGARSRDELIDVLKESPRFYEGVSNPDISADLAGFADGTRNAIELALSGMRDVEAINILGEGWTGEEAWYISLYCVLRHIDSFEDAVVAAVNHSGDSDSTGAITGNLMGAILGYEAIPECFKANLELRNVIEEVANDLISVEI